MACRTQAHWCAKAAMPRADTAGTLRAINRIFANNLCGIRKLSVVSARQETGTLTFLWREHSRVSPL